VSKEFASHNWHGVPGYMNRSDDAVALFRSSQQKARTTHIHSLFDPPRKLNVALGLQRGEECDRSGGGAAGSWILDGGVERCKITSVQLSEAGSSNVRMNGVRTDWRKDALVSRQVRFGPPQRLSGGYFDDQEG
jgi:hypothetical protein